MGFGPVFSKDEEPEEKPREAVFAQEADDEPLAILQTYIVCEVTTQGPQQDMGAPQSHRNAMHGYLTEQERNPVAPAAIVGVVAAESEDEAVKIVMAWTRRIGAYLIVPGTLIDFAVNVKSSRAQGRTLRLNP